MYTQEIIINNIPCTLTKPKKNQRKLPTIVYYYGKSSSRRQQNFLGLLFSKLDFQVIVPEIPLHGDRCNESNLPIDFQSQWEVIISAIEESRELLTTLSSYSIIDETNVSLMGYSLGGFIAAGVYGVNPLLKNLVTLNSSLSWQDHLNLARRFNKKNEVSDVLFEKIEKYDPIENIDKIAPRPLLSINGKADTVVPVFSQRKFVEAARGFYEKKPNHFNYKEIPALGHSLSLSMIESSYHWLSIGSKYNQ